MGKREVNKGGREGEGLADIYLKIVVFLLFSE
jgi:hypothetical protein